MYGFIYRVYGCQQQSHIILQVVSNLLISLKTMVVGDRQFDQFTPGLIGTGVVYEYALK